MATKYVVQPDGRRYIWKSWLHPRDAKGQFIETFAEVRSIAGMIGRVIGRGRRGGTVRVRRRGDDKEFDIPSRYLTVIARPGGKKPTSSPAPDVGELRQRASKPAARKRLRGAQPNETLEQWDADGLGEHLRAMFRDNGEDLDDRYALGVARWKLRKEGKDDRDPQVVDAEIDRARRSAGLDPTPGFDEVRMMMGAEQNVRTADDAGLRNEDVDTYRLPLPKLPQTLREADADVWKAQTGRPFRAKVWHRTNKESAEVIRSEGFDPYSDAATDQIFGQAVYLGVDDDSSRLGEQNLRATEGYEERLDAYVSLRNPLVIEGVEDYDDDEVLSGSVVDELVANALGIPEYTLNERVTGNRDRPPSRGQLREYLARQGYDGVVYRERSYSGMGGSQVVVFDADAVATDEEMLPDSGGLFTEDAAITQVRYDALPPEGKADVDAYIAKHGIDLDGMTDDFYEALTRPDLVEKGRDWYSAEMQQTAKRIADSTKGKKHEITWQDALALVAIASGRNKWVAKDGTRVNERTVQRLVDKWASGDLDGLTAQQIMDAANPKTREAFDEDQRWTFGYIYGKGYGYNMAAFLTGEMTRDEALTGPKRRSFFSNGLEPGENMDVTVDVWMANAIARFSRGDLTLKEWQTEIGKKYPKKNEKYGFYSSIAYFIVAESVRRAHERGVADGLLRPGDVPSVTQAVAWYRQQERDREGVKR